MIRYLYIIFSFVLAIVFAIKGDDLRSDVYTAAAFIMLYVEGVKLK